MCNEEENDEAFGSCLSSRKSFAGMQAGSNYNRSSWTKNKTASNIQIEPATPRNVVHVPPSSATSKASDTLAQDFKPILTPRSMGAMKNLDTPRSAGYPDNSTPRELFSKIHPSSAELRNMPHTPRFRLPSEDPIPSPRSTSSSKVPFSPRLSGRGPKREIWQDSPRNYTTSKDGWIQSTVTISDMNITSWTQAKQDLFIEAIAATCNVDLSDVCILSLREKCGRRLLSTATEITFQVKSSSPDEAASIVRELKSQSLDAMMLQVNIRIRPDTARLSEESSSQRLETSSSNFPIPFRNGYSLSDSYRMQFRNDSDGEGRKANVNMLGSTQEGDGTMSEDMESKPVQGTMLL